MSSKRALRRKQCGHKIQYPNVQEALRTIQRLRKKGESYMEPYVCQFCGLVHIGHHQPRRKEYV